MRITSKGQVTIPQEIRIQFGLFPNTEIEFVVLEGKIFIKKVSGGTRSSDLIRRMSGKATADMTTEEIMRLTRDDID